jgi:C-terminal processing protease CtpA/Prc/predicted esterase
MSPAALQSQEKRDFGSYQEMRDYLGELFKARKYMEAATLLEGVLDRFPENALANTYNLAMARLYLGNPDKAIQALEEGHRRGIFYGLWDFTAELWAPARSAPRFDAFLKENQARIAETQKKATMKMEAVLPAQFDPARKYPLFIALHGGGESTADLKPSWTSPRLRGEFITVFVQSSQVANMKGYHWQDVALTRRDLEAAYKRILEQYPVDTGRVIVGGFSSGGFGSIVSALKNFFPVRGFIVLCPEVPTTISDKDILAAKSRGLRGTLLTTEADKRVEQQRALMNRLEKSGLAVEFHMTPSIGHWFPNDFASLLDRALGFVLETGTPAVPQQSLNLADSSYKDGVLQKIAGLIESRYVLADKAKGFADAFRAKCASGVYATATDAKEFAEKVTTDLIAITGDKHLNFRVMVPSDVGEQASGSLHHPVRYFRLRAKENTGFYRLDWIEPGIGYLDLRRFYSFDQAKDMAVAAMKFLANARAIIIDVRENGGGSGDYLSSYFLPYPTQLSGSYSRQTDSLTEIWTIRDIGAEPRLDVPLFILTGPNTFSASEYFAYDMQSRNRATLIGEPTKGGAHSVDLFAIDSLFEIYISTERAVSPVTGGNWEGTGVIPDIRVSAGAALDTAVVEAKKAAEAFSREKDAGLKKAVDEMQALADSAAGLYREGKNEAAGAALDSLVRIAEKAGLISEFFMEVFAYNFQSPPDEQMLLAILTKNVELFPNSPSAYEILATACFSTGKKDLALKYFRKVLELDPGNRNAAKMIRELGGRLSAIHGKIDRVLTVAIGIDNTYDITYDMCGGLHDHHESQRRAGETLSPHR